MKQQFFLLPFLYLRMNTTKVSPNFDKMFENLFYKHIISQLEDPKLG